jgi:hypothetical protein
LGIGHVGLHRLLHRLFFRRVQQIDNAYVGVFLVVRYLKFDLRSLKIRVAAAGPDLAGVSRDFPGDDLGIGKLVTHVHLDCPGAEQVDPDRPRVRIIIGADRRQYLVSQRRRDTAQVAASQGEAGAQIQLHDPMGGALYPGIIAAIPLPSIPPQYAQLSPGLQTPSSSPPVPTSSFISLRYLAM